MFHWNCTFQKHTEIKPFFFPPTFDKEPVKEVLLDLLKTDPYKKDIYKYIIEKFGETEEISAILNYLGYDDLKDYRKV